jgi:hypothetical protein
MQAICKAPQHLHRIAWQTAMLMPTCLWHKPRSNSNSNTHQLPSNSSPTAAAAAAGHAGWLLMHYARLPQPGMMQKQQLQAVLMERAKPLP